MSNTCSGISGSNLKLKIAEEQNFGELTKTGYKTIPFSNVGLKFSQNSVESKVIMGGRQPTQSGKGNVEVSGSLEMPFDSQAIGYMFKNLFGKVETVASGDKYDHTFSISDSCLGSLAFEKSFIGTNLNYLDRGVKAKSFSFEIGGEGEIIGKFDLLGKSEDLNHISMSAVSDSVASDANVNSQTVSVNDGTKFETGDIVLFNIKKATTAENVSKGNSVIALGAGEGDNFSKGDFVEIGGHYYVIKAKSSDKIYLNKGLEADLPANSEVFLQNVSYEVTAVSGNDLSIKPGLKNAVAAGTKIYGKSQSVEIMGSIFQNFEATVYSENESAIADIEKMTFSFDNNSEGKRTIDSKGSFGKITEGKVKVEAELTLIFSQENANLLELAKIGNEMDLKIKGVAENGDMFEINMPTGTLTPDSPEISSPTSISVSLKYSPFKKGTEDAITLKLTNDIASY